MNEFWEWLEESLFTHEFFDNKFFPHEVELYSHRPSIALSEHWLHMEKQPTREDLYKAVMKACATQKVERNGVWFHANVHDQCVWRLEDYKRYPYPLPSSEKPLATLFQRMENHPADQAGTTYVGLLGDDRKWLLLIEKGATFLGADFKIRFCGSQALCQAALSFVQTKAA